MAPAGRSLKMYGCVFINYSLVYLKMPCISRKVGLGSIAMRWWKTDFWNFGASEAIAFGMQNDQMCEVTAPKFKLKVS